MGLLPPRKPKEQEFRSVVSLSWSPKGEVTVRCTEGEKRVGRVGRVTVRFIAELNPAERTLTFFLLPVTCTLFDSERMECEFKYEEIWPE